MTIRRIWYWARFPLRVALVWLHWWTSDRHSIRWKYARYFNPFMTSMPMHPSWKVAARLFGCKTELTAWEIAHGQAVARDLGMYLCDFCGQTDPTADYVAEEGDQWACSACYARFAAEDELQRQELSNAGLLGDSP